MSFVLMFVNDIHYVWEDYQHHGKNPSQDCFMPLESKCFSSLSVKVLVL